MCGRFTLTTPAQQLASLFDFLEPRGDDGGGMFSRFNIAPTQDVAAVRDPGDGTKPAIVALRWGLVPSWADDPKIGNRLINARAETVTEKPSFRDSFRSRRCLILADGFFEWKTADRVKQPFYIRRADRAPLAFAGVWDRWTAGPAPIESCTILTTTANELLAPMHQRMPVLLDAEHFREWLDPRNKQTDRLKELLRTYPAEKMQATRVGPGVNDARFDDPSCVRPLAEGVIVVNRPTVRRTVRSDQRQLWD